MAKVSNDIGIPNAAFNGLNGIMAKSYFSGQRDLRLIFKEINTIPRQIKDIILFITFCINFFTTFSQTHQRVLQIQPANLKEPSEAAIALYNKGVDYSNKADYVDGNRLYEMAIALDSDYIDAYNNLGFNFFEMNLLDSAGYYLHISLQKYPQGTAALTNLGLVEEKAGDLEKALDHFKQIISVDPQNPEGYYNSSSVLITMGKLEEGLKLGLQAEKIYANLKSPAVSDCHYLIFLAYYNLQNKPMAKKYLILCKKENVQIPVEMEQNLQ